MFWQRAESLDIVEFTLYRSDETHALPTRLKFTCPQLWPAIKVGWYTYKNKLNRLTVEGERISSLSTDPNMFLVSSSLRNC